VSAGQSGSCVRIVDKLSLPRMNIAAPSLRIPPLAAPINVEYGAFFKEGPMKLAESNEFQQEIRDCLRAACCARYRR
jgi:hypothetical protein